MASHAARGFTRINAAAGFLCARNVAECVTAFASGFAWSPTATSRELCDKIKITEKDESMEESKFLTPFVACSGH
jgi:hypothetical protein